jgi:hypothetical protein
MVFYPPTQTKTLMKTKILLSLFFCSLAHAATDPAFFKLRASDLKSGYAIKILKPIPRHNDGCDTVFKKGEVLDTCDGNFGLDPEKYGAVITFCRWDLYTVYHGDDQKEWSEPYFTPSLVPIQNSVNVWKVKNERETIYSRIRGTEAIKDRHISIRFQNPNLGELVCYPGMTKAYRKNSDYYYGATKFKWRETEHDPVYSGLSIEDIQNQLRSYIEIVPVQ